jgi:hypothetical protein
MRTVTGVELGPDSCVIARVRPLGDRVELSAVRGLKAEDWNERQPLAQNLAEARRTARLPRTARVVAWGLHESASAGDPLTRTLVAPLREAGFEVETVVSPAQALALLARRRPRPAGRGGTVWLALNRQGAAIAIVDAGELLYSREFTWHYRPAASVKDELLQRYSLVAHLAPEVRHGLDVVGAQRDVMIGSVVTCGDLPDLRSLTMPLIEELDIEVETLDTLEGLDVSGVSDRDDLAERASAVCLAVTVGAGEPSTHRSRQARLWLTAAAVAAALTLAGWFASKAFTTPTTSAAAAAPAAGSTARTPALAAKPLPLEPQPAPTVAPVAVNPVVSAPSPSTDASTPAATTGRLVASAFRRKDGAGGSLPPRGGSHASELTPVQTTRTRSDRAIAGLVRPVAAVMKPLTAPVPQVNSILVAPDRRLAVVAGEIVREGDAVGPRILIRIEPDAVVLREPSGHEVRVPIRRKLS